MKHQSVGWVEERNLTKSNFNTPLILLTLLFISGCNGLPFLSSSEDVSPETTEDCALRPPTELVLKKAEDINLKSTLEKIGEGRINSTETVGFRFQGKSGQQLQFNVTEGVCIWIIDPSDHVFEKTTLTEDGIYLVQLAAPKGKQVNYIISMGLGMKSPSPVASKTPTPRPSPSPSPSPTPSPRNQLSQQEALKIVQAWYNAKPDIFGPSYQTSAVKRYATGKLYYDTVEKCNDGICGGSVGWLKQYGCHYTYNYSDIQRVVRFSSSDSNATLVINVKEQLQLHGPRSAGCGKAANTYQKDVTYQLEKEGTTWKINSYKVGS